ncbi:30S ribosomal protein S20 [Candidatus Kaiserbacteria bacterium]|nr:30S ribosomal protein S20 [Candidatus Kaiserbacteria bacterium]
MAYTKNAKKANRVNKRRHVFNTRHKKAVKDAVKETAKLMVGKKPADAAKSLPGLYKAIDKAAKHGTIKKNTAARMKSRITKRLVAATK